MWPLDEAALRLLVLLRIPAQRGVLRLQIIVRRRRQRRRLRTICWTGTLLPSLAEEVQPYIVDGYIDALGAHALPIDEYTAHQNGVGALDGRQQQEGDEVRKPEAQELVFCGNEKGKVLKYG